MAGGYKTGAPQLRQAAKELEQGNVDLMNELKSFIQATDAVEGAWSGAAATAFQNLSRKFADDATKLNNSLNAMAEAVTGTAQAYEQQEDQASQAVSAITATLDN